MIKTYIDGVLQEDGILSPADRTKLNNLSGTNTGDETASTIITKIGDGSKINSNYLPSYVDDVLEFANVAGFPVTGEVGKIYIALDVNLTYRWGGSAYVEISPSIALGETSSTAYRGDRGASAYAHSILTSGTNPHNTTFANIASKPTTVAGYGITDGVTLVGSETLTNKTLTAPVLNAEVTGTGVTTTGEANKLVKVNSLGNLELATNLDLKGSYLRIKDTQTTPQNWWIGSGVVSNDGQFFIYNLNRTVHSLKINPTNDQITLPSLAGTGNRMVVADSTGNLSATSTLQQSTSNGTANNTAWVNIGIAPVSGFLYVISYYNLGNSTLRGTALLQSDGVTLTQISKSDNTTIGVSFRLVSGILQIITSSAGSSIAFYCNLIGV